MMKTNDQDSQALLAAIKSLPSDWQEAFSCLITHYDTVAQICRTKALTETERHQFMRLAQERNDPFIFLLIWFEYIINQRGVP